MGDRVSISFKQGNEESVCLFSHWQGMTLVKMAKEYFSVHLPVRTEGHEGMPLGRREPQTVMADFVGYISEGKPVTNDLYLGAGENDGDNSDNGHWILDVQTGKANGL